MSEVEEARRALIKDIEDETNIKLEGELKKTVYEALKKAKKDE